MNPLEVIETQSEIIRLQTDSINELFKLLMEHITAEEADNLPTVHKINLAAELKAGLEKEGGLNQWECGM